MSCANARVGGNAASSAAKPDRCCAASSAARATVGVQARGFGRRTSAKKVLKLTISSLELLLVDVQRRGHLADARDQFREVVRFGAGDRLVDDRGAAQRRGPALVGLVERLRARSGRCTSGSCSAFSAASGLRVSAVAVADQEVLQVGARVGVQRVEHLVELDRIGGLRDRDRGARGDRLRRRAARLQFDEPVAFQEDARADLQRRVGVDRQPVAVRFPSSPGRCCPRAGSR